MPSDSLTTMYSFRLKQNLSQWTIDKISEFLSQYGLTINSLSYVIFVKNAECNKKSANMFYIQTALFSENIQNPYVKSTEESLQAVLIGKNDEIFVIIDIYSPDDVDIYILNHLDGLSIYQTQEF